MSFSISISSLKIQIWCLSKPDGNIPMTFLLCKISMSCPDQFSGPHWSLAPDVAVIQTSIAQSHARARSVVVVTGWVVVGSAVVGGSVVSGTVVVVNGSVLHSFREKQRHGFAMLPCLAIDAFSKRSWQLIFCFCGPSSEWKNCILNFSVRFVGHYFHSNSWGSISKAECFVRYIYNVICLNELNI